MHEYLQASSVINWKHPAVLERAQQLALAQRQSAPRSKQSAVSKNDQIERLAKSCFEWVRDQIAHSVDAQMNPVTCRASDVLKHRTGYCFAKSHLLAALLRANNIPAGFCYQRLSLDDRGAPYCLHGFNAVYLESFGWYRIDPRGNRKGINAQFIPPQEQLAYTTTLAGEVDFRNILAEPLPMVIEALEACQTWDEALQNLPDLAPGQGETHGLIPRRSFCHRKQNQNRKLSV